MEGYRFTVEDFTQTLNIKFLKRYGYLDKEVYLKTGILRWMIGDRETGRIGIEIIKGEFEGKVRVYFTQTDKNGEKENFDYKIDLVTTKCNYGGVRWWFICPCGGNRCSILFIQNNGYFASRKTLNLCYEEQKRSKKRRYFGMVMGDSVAKIEKIRQTMKYPFRNGKPTKKMRRIFRLKDKVPTMEDLKIIDKMFRIRN